jgi:excisionase family DNA binding protein
MGRYITLDDAADRLSISKRSVRRLISEGTLPAVMINARTIRINEADLREGVAPRPPQRQVMTMKHAAVKFQALPPLSPEEYEALEKSIRRKRRAGADHR